MAQKVKIRAKKSGNTKAMRVRKVKNKKRR